MTTSGICQEGDWQCSIVLSLHFLFLSPEGLVMSLEWNMIQIGELTVGGILWPPFACGNPCYHDCDDHSLQVNPRCYKCGAITYCLTDIGL